MQLESVFLEKKRPAKKIALLRVLCQRAHFGITIADLATQLGSLISGLIIYFKNSTLI